MLQKSDWANILTYFKYVTIVQVYFMHLFLLV
jgi:hypothetical protein